MIHAFDLYSHVLSFDFMYMSIMSKLLFIHVHPWATCLHAYSFVDSSCLGYVCIL